MLKTLFKNREKLLFGWGIIVPLSYLIPKKKNLVLFMEKRKGGFFGNVKFLYLYLHRLKGANAKHYFFTESKSLYKTLKQNNLPAIFHPSLRSRYILLRTNVLVLNDTVWRKKYKFHLLFWSKKVQLWHGIPLKKIQLSVPRQKQLYDSPKGRVNAAIRGRYHLNDLFISTSEFFTQKAFSQSFRAKKFLESGYPRNDIFFNDQTDDYDLLGSDKKTLDKINKLRTEGHKIILYGPTYRDTTGDAISDGALNLNKLSEFAERHKAIFVFKFHVYESSAHEMKSYNNIIVYDNSMDIQPLLKITDILITDYSSVFMDYLLLDRPIVFFPYDYDKYIQKDRDMLFDYNEMTPGPKCYCQDELHKAIRNAISDTDDFATKRNEIRQLAFKHIDGKASERIWDYIEKHYIKA